MNEWDLALKSLRDHGQSIAVGVIIGIVCAILIMIFQKPAYQATMIVGPTERTGVPSLSSFLPQGAADAPALQYFVERIDASQSTDFTVFETVIQNPNFIAQTMTDNQMDISGDIEKWARQNLKIRPHGLTPFRKITVRDASPQTATNILNILYREGDKAVRQSQKIKTNRRLAYLNTQLDDVRNPSHRDALIALLREQEQTAMMVSIDNEFAANIIAPAYASQNPITPRAIILFPAFIFAGGFMGLLFGGLRAALKK